MTDPREILARIRAQANAATPGPWAPWLDQDGAPHMNGLLMVGNAAEVTTEAIRREVEYAVHTAAAHGYAKGKWGEDRSESIQALIKSAAAALSAVLAVTTPAEPLARTLLGVPEGHGAPRHNGEIQPGDFVVQIDRDGAPSAGIASHRDSHGNWQVENGYTIAWVHSRAERPDALTIWPAPAPPAEEVELPDEHPAHITDARGWDDERFAYMALDADGHWCGVDQEGVARAWPIRWIAAFTLPDGTRARRDGENADGKPRFVKDQEEES